MDPEDPATPCGLVAKSYFNDKFTDFKTKSGTSIKVDENGIAWATDKEYKFANVKDFEMREKSNTKKDYEVGEDKWKLVQWIDMTNEHFIVWMRYAGLPTFRKLYGKIDQDLEKGAYTMRIENNFDVSPFDGTKSLVFSTTNSLGGKSYKLATCFFIAGGFTALYFCFLAFKTIKSK